HRVEVSVVLSALELLAQAGERRGMAQQEVEGEGERRGGRLVTGAEHREQLIAQLAVAHRRALLIARAKQEGEHIASLLQIRLLAATANLFIQRLIGSAQAARKAPARAQRPEIGAR